MLISMDMCYLRKYKNRKRGGEEGRRKIEREREGGEEREGEDGSEGILFDYTSHSSLIHTIIIHCPHHMVNVSSAVKNLFSLQSAIQF
jgi:hypothetical protein